MKFFKIIVVGIGATAMFAACNNASTRKVITSDSTSFQKITGAQAPPDSNEVNFMKNENQWVLTEIELSKQVKQNSGNHRVKNFADMVITDQTSARQELSVIAKQQSVDLSDSLSSVSRPDSNFTNKPISDKAYMKSMVINYKKAVNDFKSIGKTENKPLKTWASEALPRLENGLDSARAISKSLK